MGCPALGGVVSLAVSCVCSLKSEPCDVYFTLAVRFLRHVISVVTSFSQWIVASLRGRGCASSSYVSFTLSRTVPYLLQVFTKQLWFPVTCDKLLKLKYIILEKNGNDFANL